MELFMKKALNMKETWLIKDLMDMDARQLKITSFQALTKTGKK